MEINNDLKASAERSRLMTKLAAIGAGVTVALLLVVLIFGVILDKYIGSDLFALGVIPFAMSFLFSLAAIVYGAMNRSAALEDEEKKLLEKRREGHAFDVSEDVRFTAGRSFENYRKYAPYVLSLLGAVLLIGTLLLFRGYWSARAEKVLPVNVLHSILAAAFLMFISGFAGTFFVGQSRQAAFRWLRPVGSWLLAGFAVMCASMIGAIFLYRGVPGFDVYATNAAWWIFLMLGAELVFSFVVEFYRPRTLEEPRPIFESRLLSFFTEPGGVMRNIADSLDYQFGFKVSGTWLYGFVERSIFPLLIAWVVLLWLFTGINEVGPGQVGVHERFGRIVEKTLLKPGIYYTLPWPLAGIARYNCGEIKVVTVGEPDQPQSGQKVVKQKSPIILWTKQHLEGESEFVVAVETDGRGAAADTRGAVPLSFLGMTMPIQYRVRPDGVFRYAYENRDPDVLIKRIGQEVATEYLASSSIFQLMSSGRREAEQAIRQRIQQHADEIQLGIEIVSVNLLDIHPPIEKVAPEFQAVIGAMETMHAKVLQAKTYATKTEAEGGTRSLQVIADAEAYSFRTRLVAEAEQSRFSSQLTAYTAFPALFKLQVYLDFLRNDCADIRKFVLSSGLQNEIYELNFEEKVRLDLIDADTSTLVNK